LPASDYIRGMEANLQAFLYREGSRAVSSLIGLVSRRPRKPEPEEIARESAREKAIAAAIVNERKIEATPPVVTPTAPASRMRGNIALPTREETHAVLKRRLARELYKAELDLASRMLINGKPCDCLEDKHTLGFEAMIDELVPYEPHNPVYADILKWIKDNGHKVTVEAISTGKYSDEYTEMSDQFKDFRKRVMGTSSPTDMNGDKKVDIPQITLEEAKTIAAEEVGRVIEKQWVTEKVEKTN
jgi:hypothetical protein